MATCFQLLITSLLPAPQPPEPERDDCLPQRPTSRDEGENGYGEPLHEEGHGATGGADTEEMHQYGGRTTERN